MGNNSVICTVAGGATGLVKAIISLGASLDTLWYACIGAIGAFIATKISEYIYNKLKKKK